MKKIAVFLANGFEEAEAVITIDILRRVPIKVDLFSTHDVKLVCSSNNVRVEADYLLADFNGADYDAIILPGGMGGVDNLKANAQIIDIIQSFKSNDKLIGAICAGPLVLDAAGVLNDVNFTTYPSVVDHYQSGIYHGQPAAVVDGNIITSQSVGTTLAFSLAIAARFTTAKRIKEIATNLIIKNHDDITIF